MDNKNTENPFETTKNHIEGIIVYLLKKYAAKTDCLPKPHADLNEEYDRI